MPRLRRPAQSLAEYALILCLIAIVAAVALIFLSGQVSGILSKTGTDPASSPTPSGPAIVDTRKDSGTSSRVIGRWDTGGAYCVHLERQDGQSWTVGAETCAQLPPAATPKP